MPTDTSDAAIKALALALFRLDSGSYNYAHVSKRDREKMLSDFDRQYPEQWVRGARVMLAYLEFEGFTISKLTEQNK